jgi:hypothetical protein
MRTVIHALWLLLALSLPASAHDDPELLGITDDGRRVILKQDHTWDFVEIPAGDPETSAVLTVLEVIDLQEACVVKLHLQNNLPMRIGHLVPRFNIYNQEGVLFDTVSKSFASLKPGKDKYSEVRFSGIGCSQISRAHLFSAARCRMGDIDIWNEKDGQCLGRLYVTPTDLINLSK